MANRSENFTGKTKALLPYLLILLVGVAAYFLTRLAIPDGETIARKPEASPTSSTYPKQPAPGKPSKTQRSQTGKLDTAAIEDGAIPNQRVLVFKDKASLDTFLAKMGGGLSLLGRIDSLNSLRIGFQNEADLLALLDGTEETGFIFPLRIPDFETVGPQEGAAAFGNGLLKWLGIEGDNSQWGAGVKIAILDTGIADHLAFANAIQRFNLVPLPENPSDLNGHGTAVATLIFSNNPFAPGIAPSATPMSYRIANDDGVSDSFLIAKAIVAAVDDGANIINISMGGYGRSAVTDSALAYAAEYGVPVIAPSGNSGRPGVMQPAANTTVIAVGAVDAKNQYMNFSTTGSEVAVSAAGYGINVAYPGNKAAQVSGTSFSAPAIVGTIAATMSNSGARTLSSSQAIALMNANLNDVGSQGHDPQTGAGVPDMWRILNTGKTGIADAAVTSVYTERNQVQVLVQNQGTELLINTGVSVNVNGVTTSANITTLAVGESRLVTVPAGSSDILHIQSSVQLSGGQSDQRPSNDTLSQKINPTP